MGLRKEEKQKKTCLKKGLISRIDEKIKQYEGRILIIFFSLLLIGINEFSDEFTKVILNMEFEDLLLWIKTILNTVSILSVLSYLKQQVKGEIKDVR